MKAKRRREPYLQSEGPARVIVVGTDFSPGAKTGLRAVEALCRAHPVEAVHVLSVVPPDVAVTPMMPMQDLAGLALESVQARLDTLELEVGTAQLVKAARLGGPAMELAHYAQEVAASLIVVASQGRSGLSRAVLGSVAAAVIREADVPVLIVPAGAPERSELNSMTTTLAAVDLSPVSTVVLKEAAVWTALSGARMRVLSLFQAPVVATEPDELLPHYVSPEEVEDLADNHERAVRELVAQARIDGRVDVDVVTKAPAGQAVVEVAQLLDVDLVVMGASGHHALHRLLFGSTADTVVAESGRPVLVIPHEVRESAPGWLQALETTSV